jgi:hypothetical protein
VALAQVHVGLQRQLDVIDASKKRISQPTPSPSPSPPLSQSLLLCRNYQELDAGLQASEEAVRQLLRGSVQRQQQHQLREQQLLEEVAGATFTLGAQLRDIEHLENLIRSKLPHVMLPLPLPPLPLPQSVSPVMSRVNSCSQHSH